MAFFQALIDNPFLLSAVIAGFLASIVSGIIGSYVVVKRIVFISGGIAHSVLGGIGICLWLERAKGISWVTPLGGALIAAVIAALLIGWIHLNHRQREDSAIAALWSIGMAAGVLFISQTPGYNVELTNFLIGNILWVTPEDLYFLAFLDAVVLGTVLLMHKRFLAVCFDEDQARLQGLPVEAIYLTLLVLIAITVVLLIEVVGIILVMTMLTIPPAIANLFTIRLSKMMILAVILGMVLSFGGTLTSFYFDWPAGASIALLAGLVYVIIIYSKKPR